jgi:hypothetical protein
VAPVGAEPSPFRHGVLRERRRNGRFSSHTRKPFAGSSWTGTLVRSELANRARPKLCGRRGSRVGAGPSTGDEGSGTRAAERGHRSVLRELRPASVMAELSRLSFPLAIGEVQQHSRPAARRSRFPGLLPPRRLRVPSPKNLSLGMAKLPPLGSSCTPRPSGQYVPTGQKPI